MVFCGLLSPLMNCIKPNTSPVLTHMRSKYSSDLKYYTSACQQDSDLKTFDSSLHQRTVSVMKSLAEQGDKSGESPSKVSLMEVYGFLLDLNGDVVRRIIDSKEDVSTNKELSSLVDVYFKITSKTLDFCKTVDNCVKRAEISQLIIRYAVKNFEAESVDTDDLEQNIKKKKKYAKTLDELNKFKAMGDPFDGEFLTQYESSFYEQQALLLEELGKLKANLGKKQRNVKTWMRISNILFITAYVSIFILSVVAAVMSFPPVVSPIITGLTKPIEYVEEWCKKMWKKYEKAVKTKRELVSTVETGARVNKSATDNIRDKVDILRKRISDILESVEFAVETEEDELATKLAMQEIEKTVDGLTDKIKEVGQGAARFSSSIGLGEILCRLLESVQDAHA
ncbi:unnamed protein product [Eruca vesicaria subsp. sativa]|uniref:Uncharacterized protein n=1 Tax=Eruca vesicaria subsp. sativa TaxID=29727 RepID=A0ABC8JLS2_ERUVS|nr:unnamed protein product [Eruca vesicaria subsp. sativa]